MNLAHQRFSPAIYAVAALALASCEPQSPVSDDLSYLQGATNNGFNTPLALDVSVTGAFRYPVADSPLVAALEKLGAIKIVPTDKNPYWQYAPGWAQIDQNDRANVIFARRVVENRSNKTSWHDGGSQYFAETITYKLMATPEVQNELGPSLGTFQYRLVLVNNPAVGAWQWLSDPDRGSHFLQDDGTEAQRQIASYGNRIFPSFQQAVSAAQKQASDGIEQHLARQGLVQRFHDTSVIISRRSGLAWYPLPGSLAGKTVGDAVSMCNQVHQNGFGRWRLPSPPELDGLSGNIGEGLRWLDTPDRRLFGSITPTQQNTQVQLVTNNYGYNGINSYFYTYSWVDNNLNYGTMPVYGPALNQMQFSPQMRLMCVTTYPYTGGQGATNSGQAAANTSPDGAQQRETPQQPGRASQGGKITNPDWLRLPGADELAAYYPPRAKELRQSGEARMDCGVTEKGTLTDCSIISESPPGAGFGEAALGMRHLFQMRPRTRDGVPVGGARVTIPLNFQLSG